MREIFLHIICLSLFSFIILDIVDCQTLNEKLAKLFNRTDLLCPDVCLSYVEHHPYLRDEMECCVCLAQPFWILNSSSVGRLNISFLHDNTTNVAFNNTSNIDLYNVTSLYGNLTTIPSELCNINGLVYVDFSYNNISNLETISCIISLDTLILRGNHVKYLKNNVFDGMRFLRVVDLSYNGLSKIEPGLFFNFDGSLFFFDASNNCLKNIDVSNIIWDKQDYFGVTNFAYNEISIVTNVMDWTCDIHADLGHGGYVDFTNNSFTNVFDVTEVGFSDITLLGKLYFYSFDFRYNPWFCDYRIFPIANKSNIFNQILGSDYHLIHCHSPPEYNNKLANDFIKEQDLLICNISLADKCPPQCLVFINRAEI